MKSCSYGLITSLTILNMAQACLEKGVFCQGMLKVGIQHKFNQNPNLSTDPVFQAGLPFGSSSFRLWRLVLRLMFTITRNNGMKYNSL